jgi:hypothetical protein
MTIAALLMSTGVAAWAQASAPQRGMGPRGARAGADFTPGWSMMTRQERDEHRAKMRAAQTYDECKAAMDQHREQMAARAKERVVAGPPGPRRDPCAGLKR